MASSVASSSSRVAQLLFVVAILCPTISVVSADNLDVICDNTINPYSCRQLLQLIPGAEVTAFKTLGKIAIKNAIVNATRTQNLINSLLSKTTDPQLKKNLSLCSRSFEDTVKDLQKTQTEFAVKDYSDASVDAAHGLLNVEDCIRAIGSSVPSLLANIKIIESYCSTIIVLTDYA